MVREINLDMDGTFVNFYGVDGWLDYLMNEDTTPYTIAKGLVPLNQLAVLLNALKNNGWKINIISWTSKCGSQAFNLAVADAKLQWLAKHLPSVKFNNISIVDYGTCKANLGNGILFDDEEPNRRQWGKGAKSADNLINELKNLLDK